VNNLAFLVIGAIHLALPGWKRNHGELSADELMIEELIIREDSVAHLDLDVTEDFEAFAGKITIHPFTNLCNRGVLFKPLSCSPFWELNSDFTGADNPNVLGSVERSDWSRKIFNLAPVTLDAARAYGC
jgi:hypothetical protein